MGRQNGSRIFGGLLSLVLLGGVAGCVGAGERSGTGASQREFHFTEPLEPGGRVELDSYKGNIRITGWDRPEVEVRAVVRPGSDFWSDSRWEETTVEVERSGPSLRIRSRVPERRGIVIGFNVNVMPFIDYQIHVPQVVTLVVDDYKSTTRLARLEGDLRLETYKGDLGGENLRGRLELQTYKGTARLAILDLMENSQVETYKGDIQIRVHPQANFVFEAKLGRRAHFRSDFPLDSEHDSEPDGKGRRYRRGRVGDGTGPRLSFESYKGTLTLLR